MKNCIVILCVNKEKIITEFLEEMYDYFKEKKLNYTIYITIDNNDIIYKDTDKYKIIQMDHLEVTKKGFKDSLLRYYHRKDSKIKSFALDKTLYYFSKENIYDNYWLLEEDVFIPSVKTIPYLDNKYKEMDLLVKDNNINENGNMEWHWPLMVRNNRNRLRKKRLEKAKKCKDFYLPLPWYYSFCCMIRISSKLLEEIKLFVNKNKTLIFMEFMFNTIAMHNNLKVATVEEFKSRYEYDNKNKSLFKKSEIRKKNLYSQIKDLETQKDFRVKS